MSPIKGIPAVTTIEPTTSYPLVESITLEATRAPTIYSPSGTLEDSWVTVFGFPLSATSYVLQQFKAYGDVLQYEIGDNNWIHIQYATKLQAQRALSRNGHLYGDSLLVAVVPSRKVRV